MRSCSLCAAPVREAAESCPRCGIAVAALPAGRPSRRIRLLAAAATLAALAVAALPALARFRAGDCEPQGWLEWHVAMKRACLTTEYVCANMTSANLLADPEVADAYRSALASGHPAALSDLDALVAHMRSAYGCGDSGAVGNVHPWLGASPRLPPGHPPVDGPAQDAAPRSPVFVAPGTTEI